MGLVQGKRVVRAPVMIDRQEEEERQEGNNLPSILEEDTGDSLKRRTRKMIRVLYTREKSGRSQT